MSAVNLPKWVDPVKNETDGYNLFQFKKQPKSLSPLVKDILLAQKDPLNHQWLDKDLKGKVHLLALESDKLYHGSLLGILRKIGSIIKNIFLHHTADTTAQILLKITNPEPTVVNNDVLTDRIKNVGDAGNFVITFLKKLSYTAQQTNQDTFILTLNKTSEGTITITSKDKKGKEEAKEKTIVIPQGLITLRVKNDGIELEFDKPIKRFGLSLNKFFIPKDKTQKVSLSGANAKTKAKLVVGASQIPTLEDFQNDFNKIQWKK